MRTTLEAALLCCLMGGIAYAEESGPGLDFTDKEIFKQGYFQVKAGTPVTATYVSSISKTALECISKPAAGAKQSFEVRLDTAYLRTIWNPDRKTGLMRFPWIGGWLNSKKNDVGLFISVTTSRSIGTTPDSAYIPVYLERRVQMTATGTHIGSPNRLLYRAEDYQGQPVQVQLRFVEFDSDDIDREFAALNQLMSYSQGIVAASSDPAIIALGTVGSLLVKKTGENDVLGEFDLSLIPCADIGFVPQPPFAAGYLVMIRDGMQDTRYARFESMRYDLDWSRFYYEPTRKALMFREGYRCWNEEGTKRSTDLVEDEASCKGLTATLPGAGGKEEPVTFTKGTPEFFPYTGRTYVVLSITKP